MLVLTEFLKAQVTCIHMCPQSLISPFHKGQRDPQQLAMSTYSTAYILLTVQGEFHIAFEDSDGPQVK